MSRIKPSTFVEALRDHGIVVIEHSPGGKPWHENTSAGGFDPHGVLHHHTAGTRKLLFDKATQTAMLRILQHGRAGLPGPLAHIAPAYQPWAKRAVVHLVGWGNANHAGMGDSRVMREVIADTYDGRRGTREDHDGNPDLYGLEYMHPGDDTAWPDELLDVGARAGAAICDAHGWKPSSNLEHFEWTDRKVDRSCARLAPHVNVRAAVEQAMRDHATVTQGSPIPSVDQALTEQTEDGMTVLKHPNGSAYLLTSKGLMWLPAGTYSGSYGLVQCDQAMWDKAKGAFGVLK